MPTKKSISSPLIAVVSDRPSAQPAGPGDAQEATMIMSNGFSTQSPPFHAPSPDQVYDRLDDARTSWAAMGALYDEIGNYVLRERIRMARAKKRTREVPDGVESPSKKARPPPTKGHTSNNSADSGSKVHANGATISSTPRPTREISSIPPTDDVVRIKRMAALYVHMRRAHELFQREIEQAMADVAQDVVSEEEGEQAVIDATEQGGKAKRILATAPTE